MRSRISAVLGLLIGASTLVATSPAPALAAAEPQVSPAGGIDFTGHGFGHGVGMSQYGAQGRAIKGQVAGQILGFYYPGTTLAAKAGYIRVWLKGDADSDTIVVPRSGLQLADYGKGKAYKLPTTLGAKAWKLTGTGFSSGFKLSYLNNGWHPYQLGGHPLVGVAEFRNEVTYTVTVRLPSGDKAYRGAIRRTNSKTINRTGFDSYVKGVVAAEMPSTWRAEALKSQAIAARTYGASRIDTTPSSAWDVRDTTDDQVYGGIAAETTKTTQAVTATAGKILTFGGQPADAKFSSSNGGWTVDGGTPYLPAKQDTFEGYAGVLQTWHYPGPEATLKKNLAAYIKANLGTDIGTPQKVQVLARDGHGEWNGRVTSIKVLGTKGEVTMSGPAFRFALSLRSAWFQLS